MSDGTIRKLVSDRGFGFIAASDGKEYFPHRNALEASADFDRLVGGERVESARGGGVRRWGLADAPLASRDRERPARERQGLRSQAA